MEASGSTQIMSLKQFFAESIIDTLERAKIPSRDKASVCFCLIAARIRICIHEAGLPSSMTLLFATYQIPEHYHGSKTGLDIGQGATRRSPSIAMFNKLSTFSCFLFHADWTNKCVVRFQAAIVAEQPLT
jgi:hypothetical protein